MKKHPYITGFITGALFAASAVTIGAAARDFMQEQRNIDIAIEFYDLLLNHKDWDAAQQYMGSRYIQHNPNAPDGFEGIKAHIDMLRRDFPQNRGEIKHIFSNDDLVALHIHNKRSPELRGNAVVDMFRIEDGKVVEHWDVVQAIPEKPLNDNTMF